MKVNTTHKLSTPSLDTHDFQNIQYKFYRIHVGSIQNAGIMQILWSFHYLENIIQISIFISVIYFKISSLPRFRNAKMFNPNTLRIWLNSHNSICRENIKCLFCVVSNFVHDVFFLKKRLTERQANLFNKTYDYADAYYQTRDIFYESFWINLMSINNLHVGRHLSRQFLFALTAATLARQHTFRNIRNVLTYF